MSAAADAADGAAVAFSCASIRWRRPPPMLSGTGPCDAAFIDAPSPDTTIAGINNPREPIQMLRMVASLPQFLFEHNVAQLRCSAGNRALVRSSSSALLVFPQARHIWRKR